MFNSEFWFNIHRPFMILVVLMSITAFIVILADLEWKWVENSGSINFIHSIFGIVTIGLAIIQVLCFKLLFQLTVFFLIKIYFI